MKEVMSTQETAGFTRRTFLGTAAAALFAGALIQITGCSTDDKEDAAPAGNLNGSISDNHPSPHKAVITKAQIDAGGAVTLDIKGAAGHTHTVTFTADQVADIKSGAMAMALSTSTEAHQHTVMFN